MTYNFDPDKWHEDQLLMLKTKLKHNEISTEAYNQSVLALEQELEAMWNRLDGSYVLGKDNPCA